MAPKKSFLLRLDPQLYDVLARWAADEFRSVNGHIEYLLREAARRAGRWPKGRTGPSPVGSGNEEPERTRNDPPKATSERANANLANEDS
ncbi:MAG TPA: toxin-antitoxin system HicB family antitoxin [Calditerricola sp.]